VEDWQKHYQVDEGIGTAQIIAVIIAVMALQVVTTILIVTINLMVGLYLVLEWVLYYSVADY